MRECSNCGRPTARTEDWACQWCGYPISSKYYIKIAKTFQQLKEEAPHPQEASAVEEAVEQAPESKPAPVQVAASKPEPVQQPKPEPVPEPEPIQQSMPEPEPEPVLEPIAKEATVEELISAYEADEASADAELTNKVIKLTGVVTKIEVNDFIDVYYIVLSSAEKKLPQGVRCVFDKKYGPELNRLTKEQTMTVQGKYNGSIIAMRMRDCTLAS